MTKRSSDATMTASDGGSALALAGCVVHRPDGFAGGVEITGAARGVRHFPARVAAGLGICLKRGAAHTVSSDGRAMTYPADAICVRYPGRAWSSEAATVEFLSLDIAPTLLPYNLSAGPMRFLPRAVLPQFAHVIGLLRRGGEPLRQQELLADLIEILAARGVLDAEELHDDADRRRIVGRVREFLATSVDADPTLDQLASVVETNKFVLLRYFKRELGLTPHAYLVQLKIERARSLLARGAGATEVAAATGFADLSHLSRHFKRIVGVSPGQFARQVRSHGPTSAL